ncbi:Hemagglutinin, partial [Frankliniella fusca]
ISYAQQECPAGGRQTDFVESPASVWRTDNAPPQVVRGVNVVQSDDFSMDHSIPVLPSEQICSVRTGYSLDWHNFLHTPSVESATDDQEMYSNVSLNLNATPPDFLFDADNEAEPECQDSSNLQQNLYESSDISLHDSLVSILSFAQSSHLTGVQFSKLLDLCHVLLPAPNTLPKSKHSFFKYFENDESELNCFFYCNICWKRRVNGSDKCSCPKSKVNYFIGCPLAAQIQKLYERPGFKEKLQYRFHRTKINSDNIEDIYDSNLYKEAERGFLMDSNNISLTWYTDGVAIYECSSYSLWVFVFVINELPPQERFKPENLIIGGLWGDSEKPHPNLFLLPIYQEVAKLKQGFNVTCDSVVSQVKVIVLCGTCDVPAKAAFMNMKGHSGYCSCPKCFITGEKSERTGNVCVFPHQMELELRDDENYKLCVERSLANKAEFRGVFGPSLLSFMVYSPFIRSVSIDGMHCLYLGLTKQLLNLSFNTKYSSSPFSLSSKTAEVNARLKQLQLPHFVQRSPEDVTKLAFWKASLCRNFLLYLVLIILKGLMRQDYYDNLVLLVNALSTLNSSSISVSDLEKADRDLINFCAGFENLYGLRHMSSNVHLLRHLSASVADTGNLFISSCFRFEDLNGKLSDLAHGTRHAVMQIASNFNILSKLPVLISNVSSDSVRLFCQKISGPSYHFKYCEKISKNCFVVGEFDTVPQHAECISQMCSTIFQQPIQIQTFSRLFYQGLLYVSATYDKSSRMSSFCNYNNDNRSLHGKILTFVKISSNSFLKYFALIVRTDDLPSGLNRYVMVNTHSENYDLLNVQHLKTVSFYLQVGAQHYVVDPLNNFELE